MTPRDFLYWLQGFLEIDGADDQKREGMTKEQVEVIKKHIALVLQNVTATQPATGTATGSLFDFVSPVTRTC